MTPNDVLQHRLKAIDTIESDPSHALALLCEVTRMESELRETGQRPLYPKPGPLKPRCVFPPLDLTPAHFPAPSTPPKEHRKQFDPQMKLF